jgi:hypothetical protein
MVKERLRRRWENEKQKVPLANNVKSYFIYLRCIEKLNIVYIVIMCKSFMDNAMLIRMSFI